MAQDPTMTWQVRDPQRNRTIDMTGPRAPSPAEIEAAFAAGDSGAGPNPGRVRAILDPLLVNSTIKAAAWGAFGESDPQAFKARLDKLPLPDATKAALWAEKAGGMSADRGPVDYDALADRVRKGASIDYDALAEQARTANPQQPEVVIVGADGAEHVFPPGFDPKRAAAIVRGGGSTDQVMRDAANNLKAGTPNPGAGVGERFAMGAWRNLNPLNVVNLAQSLVTSPVLTAKALLEPSKQQLDLAGERLSKGDIVAALGHFFAATPVVGPNVAASIERIHQGDVAGGAGELTGLALPAAIHPILRGTAAATRAIPGAAGLADSAARMGSSQLAEVMSPKVGQNKLRLGNQAQKIAPDLLRNPDASLGGSLDVTAKTQGALRAQITNGLETAETQLDAAGAARAANANYTSAQAQAAVLKGLTAKRAALEVGGKVPGPDAPRAAMIDAAIQHVSSLDPKALAPAEMYEQLRRLRQSYDGPAKATYAPAVTPDYLAQNAGKLGAADVTGTIRSELAGLDPTTAKANATYHLFRTADDLMQAVTETERSRPRVGRGIMAAGAGAIVGAARGGDVGAAIGGLVGPLVDRVARAAGPALKLTVAQTMQGIADALRGGKPAQAQNLVRTLLKNAASVGIRSGGNLLAEPSAQRPVVMLDAAGTPHIFPAGTDPREAAAAVESGRLMGDVKK